MGGFGSTRWGRVRTRMTVEAAIRFDLADIVMPAPWDTLPDGVMSTLTATNREETFFTASARLCQDPKKGPQFLLNFTPPGHDKPVKDQPIPLVSTTMPNGGKRWWLICAISRNGVYCGRRVRALCLPNGAQYFACRRCYDLTYDSIQERDKEEAFFMKNLHLADRAMTGPLNTVSLKAIGAIYKLEAQDKKAMERLDKRQKKREAWRKYRRTLRKPGDSLGKISP